MLPHPLLIALVIFLAVLTQSVTGFGSALVAMALLPAMLGLETAAPLVALAALTIEALLLLRYRQSFRMKAVAPLILASLCGIPLGIWALRGLDSRLLLQVLGVVIILAAAYALGQWRLPEMTRPGWSLAMGFLAGMLGGAFNTSGPPVVVYANCCHWEPDEFKGNLQGFFLVNSLLVTSGHALSHNLTALVWRNYLLALPAIAAGILAGALLDRFIQPQLFRKMVLILLILMGLRLVL